MRFIPSKLRANGKQTTRLIRRDNCLGIIEKGVLRPSNIIFFSDGQTDLIISDNNMMPILFLLATTFTTN